MTTPEDGTDTPDPQLSAAGERLRAGTRPLSVDAIHAAALERRNHRLSIGLAAALVVILGIGVAAVGFIVGVIVAEGSSTVQRWGAVGNFEDDDDLGR